MQRSIMFGFLGSRGALCRFSLDLARIAAEQAEVDSRFLISTSNELFEQFAFLGDRLVPVATFASKTGALTNMPNLVLLGRKLHASLTTTKTAAFVTLLSHVWSPLLVPVVRHAGVRHTVVVHDAVAHPGDHTGVVVKWLLQEARAADQVVTLSQYVAGQLAERGIAEHKIKVLFLPDLDYGCRALPVEPAVPAERPLRVLFFGRILPYKGLELLVEAVELLRRQGVKVKLGVFGAGRIDVMERLVALRAEVENRWIDDTEFAPLFARHDLVILSHTEASQSGIVSAAFGAGIPVLVTPVGGLMEQVQDGSTGLVSDAPTAEAVASAIRRVAEDPSLLGRLRSGIASRREQRSMLRFFDELSAVALQGNRLRAIERS